MDLNNYQQLALRTAFYPNLGNNLLYAVLGLAGETGEVPNKVKKILRDSGGTLKPEMATAIKYELGDVAWYIALTAYELDMEMSQLSPGPPFAYRLSLYGPCLGLCLESNRMIAAVNTLLLQHDLADLNAEAIRMKRLTPDVIVNPLGLCLTHLSAMADAIGSTLDEVLEANIKKLSGRQKRGTLHGNGDDR